MDIPDIATVPRDAKATRRAQTRRAKTNQPRISQPRAPRAITRGMPASPGSTGGSKEAATGDRKGGGAAPHQATPRERVESRETAIIVAACHHFAEKGFARSTISEVARTAGVAEGTVYLYFKNKEALAQAVLGRFYDGLTQGAALGVERHEQTRARLDFLARHHLENVIRQRHILQLLSVIDKEENEGGVHPVGGLVYEMNRKYVAIFDMVMREGVLRGELVENAPKWVTRDIFYGSLDYAAKSILIRARTEDAVAVVTSALVEMLMGGTGGLRPAQETALLPQKFEALTDRIERAVGILERKCDV